MAVNGPSSPRVIELRSDTFTVPTPEMYDALRAAPLGDDVYEEDPTVSQLERLAAALVGTEAALLVASGTQGNLVAVLTHCQRGSEAIVGLTADLFNHEVSGMSALGGVMPRPLPDDRGYPDPDQIRRAVRPPDIHVAPTRLICIENTHQRSGGRPIPLAELARIRSVALETGIPLHMDGARLFNAALALNVPASTLGGQVDSLTFCLSKGLSAPVGSLVCGSSEFIKRARAIRKMLGGGMRQAGWIASAGIVALERQVPRLADDHRRAKRLAYLLSRIPGLAMSSEVETNILYVDVADTGQDALTFASRLERVGIRVLAVGPTEVRMVLSRRVGARDVSRVASACRKAALGELRSTATAITASYAG
jgi:threonine aldolase